MDLCLGTKLDASGGLGSQSLISAQVPQLVENYQSKSAEGISLAFLAVWFLGDLANFIGAVWAGLVPTVIALAVYFCISDAILITQCLYYKHVNREKRTAESATSGETDDPNQPLLGRRPSSDIGLPGSRRRSSVSIKKQDSSLAEPRLSTIPEDGGKARQWIKNVACVLLVCAIGSAGWAIAWRTRLWIPAPGDTDQDTTHGSVGAEGLGYLSAVAYLG